MTARSTHSGTSKRGFGSMPKEKQKAIAKKGGEHSHGGGRASSTRGREGNETR